MQPAAGPAPGGAAGGAVDRVAGPGALFLGVAGVERIVLPRVPVQRGEHHVVTLPEQCLGAVAVMRVDVQHRNAPGAVRTQPLGR